MTNAQISLSTAVTALDNGDLTSYEESFIEDIRDYTKKELNGLSSKQYGLLRSISEKY